MTKELVIGKNYGEIFGLDPQKGQMIYEGGIKWTAVQGERKMTKECQKTTDKVIAYINQPSYRVGQ